MVAGGSGQRRLRLVDERKFAVAGHGGGQSRGGFVAEAHVDAGDSVAYGVTNEGPPGGDFLTLAVLFDLRTDAMDAADFRGTLLFRCGCLICFHTVFLCFGFCL